MVMYNEPEKETDLTDEDLKWIKILLLKNGSNNAKRISDKIETSNFYSLSAKITRTRKKVSKEIKFKNR
jgi:hypothetical protein